MGQDTDRAGQAEKTAGKRSRETEFTENDRGGAIDVHSDGPVAALPAKLLLYRFADVGKSTTDRARRCRLPYQFHQTWGARIDRLVKAVTKPRDNLAVLRPPVVQPVAHSVI